MSKGLSLQQAARSVHPAERGRLLSISALTEISRTCLDSLCGRAGESRRLGGILHDPKAVELADELGLDSAGDDSEYQLGIAVRTEIIDEVTRSFMARHPAGIVVNLGAGLDTRFHRLDNGEITWYELDLPEVIELRRQLFAEHGRCKAIPSSVLELQWMEAVPCHGPVFFVIEGLANYLEEQEIRTVTREIVRRFPEAEIVLHALGLLWVTLCQDPLFRWGACTNSDPPTWDSRLELVRSWHLFERHRERWSQFSFMTPLLPFGKNVQGIYHLRVSR